MIYGIFAILLIAYFELIGRWIAYKLGIKKLQFYFAVGFLSFLAITFVFTSVLTSNNCSFYLIFVIYSLLLLIGLIGLIIDFKRIDHSVNYKYLILAMVIVGILLFYSYNTALGDPSGFDTSFYTNFITNNIGNRVLNSKDVYLNGTPLHKMTYYNCQTYYYAIGCLMFVLGKACTLLHIEFFYLPAIVWIFQIVFDVLFANIIVEGYEYFGKKNKAASFLAVFVLVFVFGKFYYNSIFGFFGNSMRVLSVAYATLFIYRYFIDSNEYDKYLFYTCLLACCALTTSGAFIMAFYLLGLFFLLIDKDDNLLKEYGVVFVMPLYMMLNMEQDKYSIFYVYCLPILFMLIMFFINKYVVMLFKKRHSKTIFLITLFVAMFTLSRYKSNGLLDFSIFFHNKTESLDMVQSYFNINANFTLDNLFKVVILLTTFVSLVIYRKEKLIKIFIILILLLFNPFCCAYIGSLISVYYRAYEIIINPFTIMMFFVYTFNIIKNKLLVNILIIVIAILFIVKIDFIKPHYWGYTFDPHQGYAFDYCVREKYDYINKISESEMDIIRQLKAEIFNNGEKNPYIITGNLFTQTMIPSGKYLFGRSFIKSQYWTQSEKELYEIFYPVTFWGEDGKVFGDYDNMKKYIDETKINYIVVDKNVDYYDPEQGVWYSLMLKVNKECNTYPVYENHRYALYHFTY